ncbi:MAG: glucokinase [Anaerolineales bacterium]
MRSREAMILAGDVGATKTKLGLFELGGDLHYPRSVMEFQGEDYKDLESILRVYGKSGEYKISAACFGIAGPVVEGRVRMTNLDWTVDAAKLCAEFGWQHVWLINDLKAIANSVPLLNQGEIHTLNKGIPEANGTIVVLAPGTGLGVGYLNWAAGRYYAFATEGGHADFAPSDEFEDELLGFLRKKLGQVAVEHVCSGIGLPNIYEFLKASGRQQEPAWLASELASSDDATRIIVETAMGQRPGSEICRMTIQVFISALASHAGSLGLGFGATGGVYIGGGIPPRILPAFDDFKFTETFIGKMGYQDYLARFPLHVILNTVSGLLGAAAYAQQQLDSLGL